MSSFCLRRGSEGVDKVALAYYGQLLTMLRDRDSHVHLGSAWPDFRGSIVCGEDARALRVALFVALGFLPPLTCSLYQNEAGTIPDVSNITASTCSYWATHGQQGR